MRSIVFGSGMLAILLMLVGCGPGEGKVSGRVLFNGAPLPGGIVTFVPSGGRNHAVATLDEQGNFEAVVVPAGEVEVSVDNRQLQSREPPVRGVPPGLPGGVGQRIAEAKRTTPVAPQAGGGTSANPNQKIPGKYVEIPKRYYEPSRSGLKFTVQRGTQTHDIELTK